MVTQPMTVGSVTSPLFLISGGSWSIQACTNLPPAGFNFGKLVADPTNPNVLYASHGARVFKLTRTGTTWDWQDISSGLPGQWIYDLTIRRISSGSQSKVLLRAAIPTRAVWELDVTAGAAAPPISLYVRDHFADSGWLTPSPDGLADP